ncbi:MAG: pyruvate:ferredoxin (flavodoxin) oxidoreductase [Planctomycetes bacterium]|nr:pyruvate:ferredoxin (flavodoxin) oxidoreductase [Planctomycetota bacterium]
MAGKKVTIDGNQAAAYIGHKCSEVICIYPITPSSPMGEWADQWSAERRTNIWGTVPNVIEMQAEGGAAGAVHGAVQAGALSCTFTASQGLLLMVPNMFKIAGELTPVVFHVSARTVATHALSIFGDHSDVMATRGTGFALLASNSIQEVHDLALIAHASTVRTRVPFLHFFDGFRSSHEIQKIEQLPDDVIVGMIDKDAVREHRSRALSPDHPFIRGTAQNPDVFFQARETVNPFYDKCPAIVQETMEQFAKLTGRSYNLFDYVGHPEAEKVIVMMGSGAEAAHETVEYLNAAGEKIGLLKVRLYRPFSMSHFMAALPASTKIIAALDRTKEPGSIGEPMYEDVVSVLAEASVRGVSQFKKTPRVIGGRYGLSSKEFSPAMIKGLLGEMGAKSPRDHVTIGINDDVTKTSVDYDPSFSTEAENVTRAMFYGLGSDGTVGANKNSIKIIGEETENFAQGYFVYDSKKAGAVTVSHLRFGPKPIRSTYLISQANFIGCHQWIFLEKYDMLRNAAPGAVFLLNSTYGKDEVWDRMPREVQKDIIDRKIRFYVIDAYNVAEKTGMGVRINTIMQTCFFAISGVLPKDEAIAKIKGAIKKTYGRKGQDVVDKNFAAVDATLEGLHQVDYPDKVTGTLQRPPAVAAEAPEFVQQVTAMIMAGRGDDVPVSKFSVDGTFPSGTTKWEKRAVAQQIPVWEPDLCIQCGKCSVVCPHAVIRYKIYGADALSDAPATFKSADAKGKEFAGSKFTIQVAPEDCTGCGACVNVCPAKDKQDPARKAINMSPMIPLRAQERENFDFFLSIPNYDRKMVKLNTIKGVGLLEPLFEFSGACAGCGETPYVKMLSQLFGDRAVIANATGCSSIYGGNLPTTPYTVDANGRGPAWSNSLFEDNAEFGFGMRLSIDKFKVYAGELLRRLASDIGDNLVKDLLEADQSTEEGIALQRERVAALKGKLNDMKGDDVKELASVADYLVRKSVWILGGDGWAYDIGYGGLDHVLAFDRDVNVLVLDTEVYSNTGGQASKATPRGAVAKFAASGKPLAKKDLALISVTYGHIYVAKVALGASDTQCLKAFIEAESYNGPSIIVAYSHCIAHGLDMTRGMDLQKDAVNSGHWPLFRFDPRLEAAGKNPFQLDSKAPSMAYKDYAFQQTRFKTLTQTFPEEAERLQKLAQQDADRRWKTYSEFAEMGQNTTGADLGAD